MKSHVLTDARDGTLLNDFHDAMACLDVVYEWKSIRKFQKWLYNLHMKPIATRRNVKSDFRMYTTSQRNRSCTKDCVNRVQENVSLRRALTKMTTALFREN